VTAVRTIDPQRCSTKMDRPRRLADALRRESVVGICAPPPAIRELREICRGGQQGDCLRSRVSHIADPVTIALDRLVGIGRVLVLTRARGDWRHHTLRARWSTDGRGSWRSGKAARRTAPSRGGWRSERA
jgi:hypothetical protein